MNAKIIFLYLKVLFYYLTSKLFGAIFEVFKFLGNKSSKINNILADKGNALYEEFIKQSLNSKQRRKLNKIK